MTNILSKKNIQDLINFGYVKLPQLKINRVPTNLNLLKNYYSENFSGHMEYINSMKLNTLLLRDLKGLAYSLYKVSNFSNQQYNIARFIDHKSKFEAYKFHFDSHLFTLVTPVKIPNDSGKLIIFPKIRTFHKSEFINIFQKICFKFFCNKIGFLLLSKFFNYKLFDLNDNTPILFLGYESLHANMPLKINDIRVTYLTHFFDPSKNFSIGQLLRKYRNR
jgi:hypothetical protein